MNPSCDLLLTTFDATADMDKPASKILEKALK